MATPVACRWAGAEFEFTRASGQEQQGQGIKIMDGSSDRQTDGRKKQGGQ